MKSIDLLLPVQRLCTQYSELIDILSGLGFAEIPSRACWPRRAGL